MNTNTSSGFMFENLTPDGIIAALKEKNPNNCHPRLLVRRDDIPKIKDKIKWDKTTAAWADKLMKNAEMMLKYEPLKYEKEDGLRLLYVSREALDRITTLGFAYLITADARYADAATDNMLTVCDPTKFPDWNPYHFLDTAEMAAALALGYDWCYDAMSEWQRAKVRTALIDRGLKEIMRDYTYDPSRTRTWAWNDPKSIPYPQNWVAVCCGGLDMAALAIGDEDDASELAGKVIFGGMEHIRALLARFAPDGAWFEGPGYWEYAYMYFTFAFACMDSALGTDYGLTDSPGFDRGPYYIIGNAGQVGSFNMNDCAVGLIDSPEFFYLSDKFSDPALTKYRMLYMKHDRDNIYKSIIWYNPNYMKDEMKIAEDGIWRSFNVASSRSGFSKYDLYAAIHGGEDGKTVSDLDCGTFIADMFGKRWAMDLGAEPQNYSLEREGSRWDYYRSRAEGHNTVIFNPDGGNDQEVDAICPITEFEHDDNAMYAVTDLTAAHAFRGAKSVVRGLYMNKAEKCVTIQDEIKMAMPSEMYWFMHTPAQIEISADGRSAVLTQDEYKMGARLIGDSKLKFTEMSAIPLETSPHPSDCKSDDSAVNKLVIHADGITDEKFAVTLYPLSGTEGVKTDGVLTPISEWTLG